jgi:hypothetical protein
VKTCFWNKKQAENLQILKEYEKKVGIKMHFFSEDPQIVQRQEF